MGRRRNSDGEEDSSQGSGKSESISLSSGIDSPPIKKIRYKRSHKYRISQSDLSGNENESLEYLERKKHKHKHKKHKRDVHKHRSEHYEKESYRHHKKRSHHSSSSEIRSKRRRHDAETEGRSGHSSHRKKERHQNSEDDRNRNLERLKTEQQSSRWDEETDSNLLRPIKTEPLSDDSDEDIPEEETRTSRNQNGQDSHPQNERGGQEQGRNDEWGQDGAVKTEEEAEPKETVNLGLSGKLAEDTNTYNGVVIKYSQPPEARKPKRRWRWYIFKGEEELPFLPLHRQSAYLIGRERKVADIPTDHPSCSKQHAVFQYRLVSYEREDGSTGRTVKPYILDLESANGTYVNNRRIDPRRYVELLEKDVVKFGYSSREYVLLHEASKGSEDEMADAGADISPISLLRHH